MLRENVRYFVASHVQRGRNDVIRPLMRQLKNVFTKVGLDSFQSVMLQALVQIDFFRSHRLRFHDQPRAALLGQTQNEIGDFFPALAVDGLPAMQGQLRLELLQIPVQILDRLLLQQICLGAQILILGQQLSGDRLRAFGH